MKKFIYLLSIILFIASCTTSKSYLKQKRYDLAIEKSSNKLSSKPTKEKEIAVLHKAYVIANSKDRDRVNFLRSSGQADIWDEVFEIYSRMKRRQDMVKYLSPEILKKINFVEYNYDTDIHQAKLAAAEYFYANGQRLLNLNDRISARSAYNEFQKVRRYFSNFRDTELLLKKAEDLGTVNILFTVQNATNLIMPRGFSEELTRIGLFEMNQLFRRFYSEYDENIQYHYSVVLYLNDIFISPEQVRERQYSEYKEIQDGFQYKLDSKGNVMKDSLGNDIKIPKYVRIGCDIIEVHQSKSVAINSVISIRNDRNHMIIQEPQTFEWFFDNRYITYRGDQRAMSDETRRKLNLRPMPFPNTEYMILQTNELAKRRTKDFVYRNRHIFI